MVKLGSILTILVSLGSIVNQVDADADAALKCAYGFGGLTTFMEIPLDRINDGYCDCPYDGLDEPNTDACSGSYHWPGIVHHQKDDTKHNKDALHTPPTFTCPQQPDLQLPMSRLNDGICDCCDGADESSTTTTTTNCPDNCQEVLQAQYEAHQKVLENFNTGYANLQEKLKSFTTHVKTTKSKMDSNQIKFDRTEKEFQHISNELLTVELDYMTKQRTQQGLQGLVTNFQQTSQLLLNKSPWSNTELVSFIEATCQLTGELNTNNNKNQKKKKTTTCVPLRLAGLDHGIIWKDNVNDPTTYQIMSIDMKSTGQEETQKLAKLLVDNTKQDSNNNNNNPKWDIDSNNNNNNNNNNKKHHHDHHHHDDDVHHDDFEDYGDDDYVHDYHDDDYIPDDYVEEKSSSNNDNDDNNNNSQLLEKVLKSPLSTLRVPFIQQSESVLHQIQELENQQNDKDEKEEEQEDESKEELGEANSDNEQDTNNNDDSSSISFDPMAYQMVRSKLEKTQGTIQHGVDTASSAKNLLHSLIADESQQNDLDLILYTLAIDTFYYSKLSTFDLYQILVGILPEFENQESSSCSSKEQQCLELEQQQQPPPALCPIQILERSNTIFPTKDMMPMLEDFCTHHKDCLESSQDNNSHATNNDDEGVSLPPTDISDCFGGYIAPQQVSDEKDTILRTQVYSIMDDSIALPTNLVELETKQNELNQEKARLESELQTLLGDIDEDKYGPGGLLWSIKDECYAVDAGKYTYEVCILGKATQRDRGQKSGGTNLGQWDGITISEDDPSTIEMNWKHGTKCWNGPARSTQVLISCGAETKILSADEPQTCTYVLEMESYIACNDAYKQKHGL